MQKMQKEERLHVCVNIKMGKKRSVRLHGDLIGQNARFQNIDLQIKGLRLDKMLCYAPNLFLNIPLLPFNNN